MLVAPSSMRGPLIEEIERTVAAHEAGEPARIVMKMNSLVDQRCIQALYRASQAGVPIDLNVRGICCLLPGDRGVSETIRVVSVVGRFLEHSRIYAFHRGDEHSYYIGSADLMPRNLDTRVELLAPVEDPELRAELDDTLERCLADDTFAWTLAPDGTWSRRDGRTRSVHRELMERALAQASTPPNYEPASRASVEGARPWRLELPTGLSAGCQPPFWDADCGRVPSFSLKLCCWPPRLTVIVIACAGRVVVDRSMNPRVS